MAFKIKQVPLTSLDIKTPLLVMSRSGKLYQVDTSTERWTEISDHGFRSSPETIPSADGRWISYGGELRGENSAQSWLYDMRNGTDHLVLERPAWGIGMAEFSPNGSKLLIPVNYDKRWPQGSEAEAGLYMIDTDSMQQNRVELPTSIALKDGGAGVRWSADGKELLVAFSGDDIEEYFSYRPATKQVEKIAGKYDHERYVERFYRQGREIPVSEETRMRSIVAHGELSSPDGQWRAYLSKSDPSSHYFLQVKRKDGSIRRVAQGHVDHCFGKTLFITGWLDNRYLVYSTEFTSYYVFDTATGSAAVLFDGNQEAYTFTW